MFGNYKEQTTFENALHDDEPPAKKMSQRPGHEQPANLAASFFTPELQEKVGKALLDIKLKLYKEGLVDFDIKVAQNGNQVTLTAVPKKAAAPRENR